MLFQPLPALLVASQSPCGGVVCAGPAKEKESADFVVISAWRHCRGLMPLGSFLAAALTPPTPVAYEFDWQIADGNLIGEF